MSISLRPAPLTITLVLLALTACAPASPDPAATPTPAPGISISAGPIHLLLPLVLAANVSVETVDAVTDQANIPWDVGPAHLQLTFHGYPLPATFHDPVLVIYPREQYAIANPNAAESISRLVDVLANPSSASNRNALPRVPFFNAGQVLAAQPKVIAFHGGSGIRFVAHYTQDISPINNRGLFYHFEGLTDDQQYYLVGVFPINLAILSPNNNPDLPVPTGGVPFPLPSASPLSYDDYYRQIGQRIDSTPADEFRPSLDLLDELTGSITFGQ